MFAFIITFLITIAVAAISFVLQQKWKYRLIKNIPGPPELPFLGNGLEFGMNPVAILNDLTRIMDTYGTKDGICKVSIGPDNVYILLANPEVVEFFINSTRFLKKNTDYDRLRPWIANGLLTSTGSYWQKRRKAITPTFHFKILEQFVPMFNEGTDLLMKRLSQEVGKDVCDIYPFITACALDTICETAMGTSVHAQDSPDNEYVRAVKTVCQVFIKRTFSPWKQIEALFRLTQDYQIQNENLKIIHDFTRSVIQKRRQALEESSSNSNSNKPDNDFGIKKKQVFLDLLLRATIDGKPLTDDDITEEVDTFMFEGHDTTASAICFCLYELSRNPDIQKKVYDEVSDIFLDDKKREATLTDLNNMKYLENVLKETLRLYPSVPFYARDLQEDVTFQDKKFCKGISILFFPYYMHRRGSIFTDPLKFNPERYSIENNQVKNPFSYIPFSAGPRNCIGQKFAMYEMKAVVSKVLRNFELFPVGKEHEVVLSSEVILKSATGVCIRLEHRK